jgi:hypothetical protein
MAEAKKQLYRLRRGLGEKRRSDGLREQGTRSEKREAGFGETNGLRVAGGGFQKQSRRCEPAGPRPSVSV